MPLKRWRCKMGDINPTLRAYSRAGEENVGREELESAPPQRRDNQWARWRRTSRCCAPTCPPWLTYGAHDAHPALLRRRPSPSLRTPRTPLTLPRPSPLYRAAHVSIKFPTLTDPRPVAASHPLVARKPLEGQHTMAGPHPPAQQLLTPEVMSWKMNGSPAHEYKAGLAKPTVVCIGK